MAYTVRNLPSYRFAILASVLLALASTAEASDFDIQQSFSNQYPAGAKSLKGSPPPILEPRENTLILPRLTGPQFPLAPPALQNPEIPSRFLGCWQGTPHAWDSLATDAGLVDIGSPGKITFCYTEHAIEVPEAQVTISASARVLDWLAHFGLGYSSFRAHSIRTDIYAIKEKQIYARTNLVIDLTDHWLYVFPSHIPEPCDVESVATLIGTDSVLVQSNQVITLGALDMWGSWHAFFHRVNK